MTDTGEPRRPQPSGRGWPFFRDSYPGSSWRGGVEVFAGCVASFFAVATIVSMLGLGWYKGWPTWKRDSLILWAAVPPAWFWFHYYVVWKPYGPATKDDLEFFKYGQEVSRNIWLALVALLAGLYFK